MSSPGRGLMVGGALLMVVAALLPVAASLLPVGAAATVLWLVSMPGCLAGAALTAAGLLRRRRGQPDRDEGWG
ncbi:MULTISPECIES: hypothetical protein [unclassified Actinomyces]|uniref:hypothetical protein n=1 Tax=unclassified Actinomyces TaxID=2609248 RepID=UPI0020179D3E|nr:MULTISPECIES: hypothetical protein [unclassified Actinomyces]MCL3777685.1 hypothetical protein [Actinomyces sp. AC-20-1]MCL3789789.1 hypothetical protein [Actinomyces sp. 187325]MCL3791983.1 hypothetical protein [Actinomyces sp. 186855]MCL3794646.1 hypothetical protein [Actinomyces sp. 217892]